MGLHVSWRKGEKSKQEIKRGSTENCETLKCLREDKPRTLKLSTEAGADAHEEKALCKGVDCKRICVPWGVTEHMKSLESWRLAGGGVLCDSVTWKNA